MRFNKKIRLRVRWILTSYRRCERDLASLLVYGVAANSNVLLLHPCVFSS